VTSGADATVRQILLYTLALAGTVMLPYLLGFSGMLYAVGAGVASAIFVGLSLLLALSSCERRNRIAGMVFAYSIFYLFIVFALLPADRLMASGL
jgi:protoheme IX farnesyltransferase